MDAEMPAIITRAEAKARGLVRYFTGSPCRNGHVDERAVSSGTCLACAREMQAQIRATTEGRARVAEIKRRSRQRHADKVKAYRRRYLEERRAEHSERCRRWHERASADPAYRQRKAAATRDWAARNPTKARLNDSVKRARKRAAKPDEFGEFDRFVIEEAFAAARRRAELTGIAWHVDHMVPLARGGAHAWHNIQVIPAEVNLHKRDRMIFTEPLQWLDFYDGR